VAVPEPGDYMPRLEKLLPHVDVFLPNHDEAAVLSGLKDPFDQAEFFRQRGVKTAVVTMGGEGAVLVQGGLRLKAGVFSMPYVDGSGGGDAMPATSMASCADWMRRVVCRSPAPWERVACVPSALHPGCSRATSASNSWENTPWRYMLVERYPEKRGQAPFAGSGPQGASHKFPVQRGLHPVAGLVHC
jgi:hypothetical protein